MDTFLPAGRTAITTTEPRHSVVWASAVIHRAVRAVALLIPVLLLSGAVEAQTPHVVTIGYCPDLDLCHFGPARLTIPVGDTVVWRTRYGGIPHNITWPAGEFPPSPTSPGLRHSQTFDSPGEFRYRCTVHGRSGEITVVAPNVPFGINAGLNDAWKDPATPGQGFFINVFPDIGQVFLAWFTYDTERPADSATASIGEPGHRWLTASGPYADNQAVLDIEITQGGVFNAANPAPTQHLDGTIILEFRNCYEGTLTYDLPSIGQQGVIPIERISSDNVAACEALVGAPSAGPTAAIKTASNVANRVGNSTAATGSLINRGLNDAWKNPATPGQGFFMNVFPGLGQMFLAWFTYDTTRPPGSVHANLGDPGHRWITAFGPYTGNQAVLDIEITQGGIFDEASPAPTQHGDGTVTVDMTDCENGTITYDIDSANLRGEIPIQRIALDNVPLCESLAEQLQQSR